MAEERKIVSLLKPKGQDNTIYSVEMHPPLQLDPEKQWSVHLNQLWISKSIGFLHPNTLGGLNFILSIRITSASIPRRMAVWQTFRTELPTTLFIRDLKELKRLFSHAVRTMPGVKLTLCDKFGLGMTFMDSSLHKVEAKYPAVFSSLFSAPSSNAQFVKRKDGPLPSYTIMARCDSWYLNMGRTHTYVQNEWINPLYTKPINMNHVDEGHYITEQSEDNIALFKMFDFWRVVPAPPNKSPYTDVVQVTVPTLSPHTLFMFSPSSEFHTKKKSKVIHVRDNSKNPTWERVYHRTLNSLEVRITTCDPVSGVWNQPLYVPNGSSTNVELEFLGV